jgi:response regulator RpfG family c-di-GMP phosphodiesterase
MPEMDGYEMAQSIRRLKRERGYSRIPIVAITGACFSVGMDDFLSKPIKLNDLKLILNKWISKQLKGEWINFVNALPCNKVFAFFYIKGKIMPSLLTKPINC